MTKETEKEFDVANPNGCELCGTKKHMPSECPTDGICGCHLKQEIKDEYNFLRGLLCNGTTDCENSPECPVGTDGCVVQEIRDYYKKQIEKTKKSAYVDIEKAKDVVCRVCTHNWNRGTDKDISCICIKECKYRNTIDDLYNAKDIIKFKE